MQDKNEQFYQELLKLSNEVREFTKKVNIYPSQFSYSELNHECYDKMYGVKQDEVKPRPTFFQIVTGLEEECKKCWGFYLSPRNSSIRILDIQLGKKFQKIFSSYMNTKLPKEMKCVEGDKEDKKYPDLRITKNGQTISYIELKYQSAPLIFAYKQEGKRRECYEGSSALDIKKLQQQWELKTSGKITAQIYYVFWLDFPCIKGVFYMTIEEMWEYYHGEAEIFTRKTRKGDFTETSNGKRLAAAIQKIHPSIYQMRSFEELLKTLGCTDV